MKICHMTSVHSSSDARIFQKECVSLAKKENYQVFLVAPGASRREKGVTVVGIGDQKPGRWNRMLRTRQRIYGEALALGADVYHLHDPELLPYGKKLKKQGKIVIYDSHEDYPLQMREKHYIPHMFRQMVSHVYLRMEDRVCKEIDGVIYPNLEKGKHPFEGRAKVIATVDNMPLLEELYDRYEGPAEKKEFAVCYVGSLSEARGITNLTDACYEAGTPLILGGNFSSQQYEDELRARKSFACVDYRGVYDRNELKKILEEASLGASTLLPIGQYRDMGNLATKVYEYMSMGLPVILSDHPYGREVVGKHDFAVLVDAEDPGEMARAIRKLKADPTECSRLGENGRKAVKTEFNWEIEEEKLYRFYREVCGE